MRSDRNGTVDALRYAAAAGIVWFHAGAPLGQLALAALPLFTLLLARFAVPAEPDGRAALRRAAALIRLWLVWSAIFAALKAFDALSDGRAIATEFGPWMWLTGPTLHLWFLPFAAVLTLAGHAVSVARAAGRRGAAAVIPVALALGVAAIWLAAGGRRGIPFDQWLSIIPAAALGLAMAVSGGRARLVPSAALLAAFAAMWLAAGAPMQAARLVLAALVMGGALVWVTPSTPATLGLRHISLSVYLVHPAIMAALMRVPGLMENRVGLAVLSIAGATLVAVVLREPHLARVFGLPHPAGRDAGAGLTAAAKATMIPPKQAPEQNRDIG